MRYAVAAGPLHWRRWEDEMVVYDTASGSTHLLTPAASEVLQALLESPAALDAQALAALLLPAEENAAQRRDDARALQSLLSDLARLGLVHEVSP